MNRILDSYWKDEDYDQDYCRKTLLEMVTSSPAFKANSNALRYFKTSISNKEFMANVLKTSIALKNLGVKRDEIIPMFLLNTPEFGYSFYAVNNIGGISEWFNPRGITPELIRNFINDNNIRFMIISDVVYPVFKEGIKGTNIERVIVNSLRDSFDNLTDAMYITQVLGINSFLNQPIAKKALSKEENEQLSFIERKIKELDGYAKEKLIKAKASFHIDKNRDEKFITWADFIKTYYLPEKFENYPYEDDRTTIIVHTGGTTGTVKRIACTDYGVNSFVYKTMLMPLNMDFDDSFCQLVSPIVGWSLSGFHLSRVYNMSTRLIPSYDKREFVDIMLKYRLNHYFTVPAFLKTILNNPKLEGKDLSFIKSINHGGEAISPEDDQAVDEVFAAHGCTIKNKHGFGQNEEFGCFTVNIDLPDFPKDYGCCGIPLIGNEAIVVDPITEEKLPIGHDENGEPRIGRIYVSGSTVMKGYYGEDACLNEVVFKEFDGKRFFNTGDQGWIDENGKLWFYIRDARIIRTQIGKVFATVLENIINKFDEVKECCVVGAPNPTNDKEASCHIILQDIYYALPEDELKAVFTNLTEKIDNEVKGLYEYYKPGNYVLRKNEFPATSFGKVDFRVLEDYDKEEYEKGGKKKLERIRYTL